MQTQFFFGAEIYNPQKKKSAKIKCLLFRPKPQKLPVIQYILLYFQMESTHYEGLLTTMIGYVVIAFSLVVLYMLCAIARLKK
jgi:hypothetical protein